MGKSWGMKTAWAKSFFVPEGDRFAPVPGVEDTLRTGEEKEERGCDGSSPHGNRVKRKDSSQKLTVPTSWRCLRCGSALTVPIDPHTGRPSFCILAEHLEGVSSSGTTPLTGVEPCQAGVVRYVSTDDRRSALDSGKREKALDALRQLLFGEAPKQGGNANNGGGGGAAAAEVPVRVFVAVENPKTPANVGGILRAIGCFGFCGLLVSGSRLVEAMKHRPVTDTQAAGFSTPYVVIPDVLDLFEVLDGNTSFETTVVAVDMIDSATPLPFFHHPHLHGIGGGAQERENGDLPKLVVYLFGAEDGSIRQDAIARCQSAVFLPTQGSLNLAAAVNVVLYDRCAAQWRLMGSSEDMAREGTMRDAAVSSLRSRNANNRTMWNPPISSFPTFEWPSEPEKGKRMRAEVLP